MADDNRSGLQEAAGAAHAVRGAIKTGKAVAGAAKGAAMGGPFGAAAGALGADGRIIWIVVAALLLLFLIPVIIIVMLPVIIFSLIAGFFSGLFGGGSPADTPVMVMNDNAAIIENIGTIGSALNVIMLEGLDDLYVRIDNDFAASSGGRKEITDPYEGGNIIDVNLIISQYCAANYQDIEKISLADLERTVRAHKNTLFAFEKRVETETYTVTDPETEEETTVEETAIYYTVVYIGDTYFADSVFFLTPEQKALAADYNSNLRLFLNDAYR